MIAKSLSYYKILFSVQTLLVAMKVIALETSSDFCSLALSAEGTVLTYHQATPRQHNQVIIAALEDLIARSGWALSGMDAVVYGKGPGSFTGVRISAAIAQAISMANNLPLHSVSSLAAMAFSAPPDSHVLTLLNAHLGELYWCAYRRQPGGLEPLVEETVSTPDKLIDWLDRKGLSKWIVLGDGGPILAQSWPELSRHEGDYERAPKASDLIPLMSDATSGLPDLELPVYLKAERPWRK